MRRSLCEVVAGDGDGLGGACLVVTFASAEGRSAELRQRLLADVVPGLSGRRGLAACRLLENSLAARMTREQALRGRDGAVRSALWVTGYDVDAIAALAMGDLGTERLTDCGAAAVEHADFRLAYSLSAAGALVSPCSPAAAAGTARCRAPA